jgi:hypothetical protein
MKMLGRATAALLATVTAVAVVVGWRSIPDIRRYLKIRRM